MFDLMALSFQADITRISTFMMAREVSYRTFPKIGIPDAFHPTSHHQNDPEKLEKLTKINTYHVSLIAHFLEQAEGDSGRRRHPAGSFADSVRKLHEQQQRAQPFAAAGVRRRRRCGKMKGGRHMKYPDETPMANLLLTILDKAGVHQDAVGDSTGLLSI